MISTEQKETQWSKTLPPVPDGRSPCTVHVRLDKFIANQMKGWDMKPHSTVLLLMAVLIAAVLMAVLIIIGLFYINPDTGGTPPQTITISPTSIHTPRPVFTTIPTQSDQDPIIGPWLNGMVFYANGTVGSEGITSWQSWQVNTNENNSYFVLTDMSSEGGKYSRDVTSTEWLYNPASDKINKRGSLESFARGIPKPTPTPITTVTTIHTQLTQVVTTTTTPASFSYNDCISACKIIFSVDRNNGAFNDCLQTCNIENLKVPG
jgi:hypothetical protein